jgi:branched-chain amino acid transport system substrate-binding protein
VPKTANRTVPLFLSIVALLGMLLSACSSPPTNTSTQTIKIGVSLSLTGDSSADGQATKKGYEVWQDFVNSHGGLLGRQVQMDILDDGTKTDQTHTNYEKLISIDHVNFVVGPFNEAFTVTGAEVAARHGYAFVEGIGESPSTFGHGFKNLFAVSLPATSYLNSFVNYLLALPQQNRPKTVAYATGDDPFTQPQIDSARPKLEIGGLKTAFYKVYPAETTDYKPVAQQIIAANPDVVILGTQGLQDCVGFLQFFKQQHFNPKLILATAGPDNGQDFTKAIGGANAAEGLLVPNAGWFPTVKSYQNDLFVPAYLKKYGGAPGDIASDSVQAFSTGQVLAQAVTQANSLDNGAVMQVLRKGTFQSLQGPVQFAPNGENKLILAFLFQWQKQQLIPVYPPSAQAANLEYPKPKWP